MMLCPFQLPWRRATDLFTIFRLALGVLPRSALVGLITIARGKRQRGWNQLSALASRHERYYQTWISRAEPVIVDSYCKARRTSTTLQPVCVVLDCETHPGSARETIASLRQAFGSETEVWIDHGKHDGCKNLDQSRSESLAGQLSAVIASHCFPSSGDHWVMFLRAGDHVSPYAGQVLSGAVPSKPCDSPLFWDEDSLVAGLRCAPWLKGEFDEWLYLARDSLAGACLIPAGVLAKILRQPVFDKRGTLGAAEIILSGIARSLMTRPIHVPLILTHRLGGIGFSDAGGWANVIGRVWPSPLQISENTRFPRFLRVLPRATHWPSVSIIIPSKDRASLLAACLASLADLRYPGRAEIIIVDNGSTDPDALQLIQEVRTQEQVRIIRQDGPFNFSTLNNLAAHCAQGEILCLMNNDVTAIDGTWLASMVSHVLDPQVGAVGARLLYPSDKIQHAGVVIGMGGVAGHVAKGAARNEAANSEWHGVSRTVSAVTAACLVVRREHYLLVGGLDEEAFPVAFNDVDFCLRLQAHGLVNRFVAEAELYHHESISRGNDSAPENLARFNREIENFEARWRSSQYQDPWYSPLLARTSEACTLQF